MNTSTMRHSVNWPLLAAMRFALALTVAFWHLYVIDNQHFLASLASVVGGFGCVGPFLLISGFSIAHSLGRETNGFYKRRLDRICPVYFACLLLAFIPYFLAQSSTEYGSRLLSLSPDLRDIIATALLLPAVLGKPIYSFGPSWSLGVEMLMYAVAPLFLRLSRPVFAWLLALLSVVYVLQGAGLFPYSETGIGPILRCAVWWLLGWCIYQNQSQDLLARSVFLVALAPGLFALNSQHTQPVPALTSGDAGPLVMALVTLGCVVGHQVDFSATTKRIFVYLGDLSYPLYLVHYPIYWILAVMGFTSSFMVWMYPLAALVGAAIILHGVDYPYRTLARRRAEKQGEPTSALPVSP